VLSELGLDDASLALSLHRAWDDAIGAELAPHCRPEGARGGVIQARVRDSAWMVAVQMRKHELLARLREALAPEPIHDVRLRLGPFEE
jgi:predicted nucleic acid-binding Zn ribbon protein